MKTEEEYVKMNFKCKTDEDLLLVYDNEFNYVKDSPNNNFKSIIYNTKTKKPIATQYNKIIIGLDNITDFINNNKFSKLKYKLSYEGTHIIVFFNEDKWYICTKKNLDANLSFWCKEISFYKMFMDSIENKFTLDDLDKKYCYHFNLIHHQNFRNIKYVNLGENYATVDLIFVTEKETLKIIDMQVPNVLENIKKDFKNLDEFLLVFNDLVKTDKENINNSVYLQTEGLVIEHYDMENNITLLKHQTPIYEYIYKYPTRIYNMSHPKYDLLYKQYLINFHKLSSDTANNYEFIDDIDYITKLVAEYFNKDIIKKTCSVMSENMKKISIIIGTLYYFTRHKINNYEAIPSIYKTLLYTLHGIFLKERTNGFKMNKKFIFNFLHERDPVMIKQLLNSYDDIVKIINSTKTTKVSLSALQNFNNIVLPNNIFN